MARDLRHTAAAERSLVGLAAHIAVDLAQVEDNRAGLAVLAHTAAAPAVAHKQAGLAAPAHTAAVPGVVERTLAVDTRHWGLVHIREADNHRWAAVRSQDFQPVRAGMHKLAAAFAAVVALAAGLAVVAAFGLASDAVAAAPDTAAVADPPPPRFARSLP